MHAAAVIAARPAWSERLPERLQPGANVVLLTSDEYQAIEARRAGFELRDTILLLWPKMTSYAFLLRRPLQAGTLDSLIESGGGAFNIRACRVGWQSEAERKAALPGSMPKANDSIGTFQTRDRSNEDPEDFQSKDGRWPANVALIHGPHCHRVGETRIEGHKGYPHGPGGSSVQFSQKGTRTNRQEAWAGHADADGKETVAVWACQESCPNQAFGRTDRGYFHRNLSLLPAVCLSLGASRLVPYTCSASRGYHPRRGLAFLCAGSCVNYSYYRRQKTAAKLEVWHAWQDIVQKHEQAEARDFQALLHELVPYMKSNGYPAVVRAQVGEVLGQAEALQGGAEAFGELEPRVVGHARIVPREATSELWPKREEESGASRLVTRSDDLCCCVVASENFSRLVETFRRSRASDNLG